MLAALVFVLALSASARAQTGGAPAACDPAKRTGRFFVTLPINGVQRSALVNVPPSADGRHRLPVVLMYHGAGSTGPKTERDIALSTVGNRYGFITVYPTSNTKYWNVSGGGPHGDDDIQFTRALLDYLDRHVCVDDTRVYATGGSNGGGLAYRVACELSDRVAAVATVAGVYGLEPPCNPTRPISILEMHGTADTTVPYAGWGPHGQGSVPAFIGQWLSLDQCPNTSPNVYRFAPHATLADYYGCAGGTTVAAIKLVGGTHQWPGPTSVGADAPRVDHVVFASLAVWRFFACQASATPATGPCPAPQRTSSRRRRG